MATDTVPSAPAPSAATTAPNPAWAVAWGGGMLILLALWLRAKFEDLSFSLIGASVVLGVAAAALAVWQLVRAVKQPANAELNAKLRREAAIISLSGGVAMIFLAVALGVALGLAGFGEYVGLALLGIIALAAGRSLSSTGPTDLTALWTQVRAQLGVVKFALVVLGGGSVITFLVLSFGVKPAGTWHPEYFALMIGGFFCLGAAFWLQLQSVSGEMELVRLRLFVLVVGGVLGFIITVMILWRMFLWRNEVFLGGLDVWLGDGFWRFWLCAYALMAGLALMFGSLFLARADVHTSITLRRWLYGYNTVFGGVLLLQVLILANVFFYILVPYTINWSRTSFSTLSPRSKSVLANLKQPTTVYVLLGEGHPAMSDLKILMENCRIENNRLKVNYVSPDLEPKKYLDLAGRYKEIQPERSAFGLQPKRGVLLVYGDIPDDPALPVPPHTFVPDNKIYEETPGMRGKGRAAKVFKAEPEILKELHHLSAGKQTRKLYFLQGNGELDINNQEAGDRTTYHEPLSVGGCFKLVERLKKDNFEVQGLKFEARIKKEENIFFVPEVGPDKKKDVPEDAYAVVLAGPSEPMPKETLDAIERYVDKGGRLLVFFETIFDEKYTRMRISGFEEFLRKYGVDVRPEYAIMLPVANGPTRDLRDSVVFTPPRPETLLAKQFKNAIFTTARIIKTLPPAGPYKADVLFQLDPAKRFAYWSESDSKAIANIDAYYRDLQRNQDKLEEKIMKEPLPVAVTVTQGMGELAKPRMVIFGDADFILNDERILRVTYDIVASSLEWMADKGGYVGPAPREQASYNVPIDVDGTRLFVYPGLLMLLVIAGMGTGLWLVRRR